MYYACIIMAHTHLDLSLGAWVAADRSDHLSAVRHEFVITDAQETFMPRPHLNVIKAANLLHILQIHNVIPQIEEKVREAMIWVDKKKRKKKSKSFIISSSVLLKPRDQQEAEFTLLPCSHIQVSQLCILHLGYESTTSRVLSPLIHTNDTRYLTDEAKFHKRTHVHKAVAVLAAVELSSFVHVQPG